MPNISRKVYYYRAYSSDPQDGFGFKLKKILTLAEPNRECTIGQFDMNLVRVYVGESENLICGTARILRFIAPSKGRKGTNTTSPIDLMDDEGINEKTHFVYDLKSKILAVEYNHHGPKISHIKKYVDRLYRDSFDENAKNCGMNILLANTAREILKKGVGVRKISFEIENL